MTAAAETRPILRIEGLNAHIAGQQVVEDVSFTVPATGITALLGRNGVGKTSTIKAIIGLIDRTGAVELGGVRIEKEPTFKIIRSGVGYVPEDREVFSKLTVAENLRLAERDDAPRRQLVEELFPDLLARSAQMAGTLSGGQQQMVSLARALLNTNKILLVDEPTKGLAPKIVAEVAETLAEAAKTVPILLVEQNLHVVRQLAEGAVVLSGGRVVHTGSALEFLDDAELTQRLLGVSAESPAGRTRRNSPARENTAREISRERRRPVSTLVLLLFTGLGLGALYFLVAAGLSLIYGLMGVLNFAHGAFLTLGAFAGWEIARRTGSDDWGTFLLSLLVGAAAGAAFAAFTEFVLIRRLYQRHIEQLLITVGLSLAAVALFDGIWGTDPVFIQGPAWFKDTTEILGARVPNDRFVCIVAAVLVLLAMVFFLKNTRYGMIIRAGVENRSMVTALGIDVRKAFTLVFTIGGAAAGLGGVLASHYFGYVSPMLGGSLLIFAFIVTVIGGLGSLTGAAIAAVAVAVLQQFANFYLGGTGDFVVVLALALVLLFRPSGLLGRTS